MIDKIAAKIGFSLLKWLPLIAATAFMAALAPKAALAQSTPSTIGYVVSGCGVISDRGDYYYIGTDDAGHPYYESATGVYLFMSGDDQDNRPYDRWYIGTGAYQVVNGQVSFAQGGDYETGGVGGYWLHEAYVGPATGGNVAWQDDGDPSVFGTRPTVTSM